MSSNFREKYKGQHFKALYSTNPMETNVRDIRKDFLWIDSEKNRESHFLIFGSKERWADGECGYSVDYFRVVHDRGKRLEMRWGTYVDMSYDNGLVGFPQCDTFRTLEDAKAFIEVKRKVVNNWYCGFGIHKTVYDKKLHLLNIETIMECESVNATAINEL